MFCLVETTLRVILLTDSANILLISGAESYDRRDVKVFGGSRRTSRSDSDQGCVAGIPLAKARLKRMKKVSVFDGLGSMPMNMSFKRFCPSREERYWPK